MTEQSITRQVKKYKLVFIGDQSVGKTSIINRFIYDNFVGTQQPTVGIDFVAKTLHLDNKTIRLQLWDTAGQERFRSLIPSYIRDSDAAILTYDVTKAQSFQNLSKWIEYVKEERGNEVLTILLGNKIDLQENRQKYQLKINKQKIIKQDKFLEKREKSSLNNQVQYFKRFQQKVVIIFLLYLNKFLNSF
ncbi:ras small monomeric gtpase, putative [Ichthyophthirius multifiliis]|uniref:Ras small monomeric gtpase, putative n=1 Tax=Ichthyophthirius multifiliis TaxID=5932 RepID=G0QN99_ICHMU|nr:ras small monomeric gtpase, putative [Ichthyophthirius multifiliis]EGR33304.1 ras small monomeric gtpase, putative [Ichthyophthirius multifiliis]|eukprot:XP_004037290.1 ras small monomeric gtpase, putative [Ichthyophthirius multifiliis]